jgi:hypothetical protein
VTCFCHSFFSTSAISLTQKTTKFRISKLQSTQVPTKFYGYFSYCIFTRRTFIFSVDSFMLVAWATDMEGNLFVQYLPRKLVCIHSYQWMKVFLSFTGFHSLVNFSNSF